MGKIIGITGGISSGKSTVTNFLRQRGFQVVDADALVHQLQAPGGRLYNILVEHFGNQVLLKNGQLNRPLLVILEELAALKNQLAQTEAIFFMDIPLLFEQGYESWFDEVWLIYLDRETQIERLMNRDKLSLEAAEVRLASQWPLDKKKKLATHTIDNSGSLDQLLSQIISLLERGEFHERD